MIERKGELIAGHAEVAKRIPGADQHGSGRHRAGEHPGRQADIPAEELTQSHGDQHCAADHYQREHQVIFPIAKKNRKKVGSRFYADAKNKQHKAEIEGVSVNTEMLLP